MGNPLSTAFVPNFGNDFTDEMTLFQRTVNYFVNQMSLFLKNRIIFPKLNQIGRQVLNRHNLTPIAEIERNVALMITNTHFSLNYQFVKSESIVEVGGLHCAQSRPLPKVI